MSLIKKCEICEISATCLCLNCNSYYCDSCFKYVHDKQTKNNHNKESIDAFIPIDTKCPDHPNIPINLFCVDEKGKKSFYFIYRTLLFILLL